MMGPHHRIFTSYEYTKKEGRGVEYCAPEPVFHKLCRTTYPASSPSFYHPLRPLDTYEGGYKRGLEFAHIFMPLACSYVK
jgi:hypothetical protein